ncbi:glutaredoxin family protein [Luteococcus sp. Sow4_B9]|uniref:glutaredoxin family protein n=1 Tax=Luteococcus sp. Sow4_B9 TaxID=3438792 RepID=UPI003F98E415
MRLWPKREASRSATAPAVADVGVPAAESAAGSGRQPPFPVDQWGGTAEVVLLTRAGCHLCEMAEPVVRQVCTPRQVKVAVVDVDCDDGLRSAYTNHVPVVFVRGEIVDYWQVDAERLARAIDGHPFDRPAPL